MRFFPPGAFAALPQAPQAPIQAQQQIVGPFAQVQRMQQQMQQQMLQQQLWQQVGMPAVGPSIAAAAPPMMRDALPAPQAQVQVQAQVQPQAQALAVRADLRSDPLRADPLRMDILRANPQALYQGGMGEFGRPVF